MLIVVNKFVNVNIITYYCGYNMDTNKKIGYNIDVGSIKFNNNLDLLKFIIKMIAATKDIKLSDTEITVIALFNMEGADNIKAKKIVEHKILNKLTSAGTLLSRLAKREIIIRTLRGRALHSDFTLFKNADIIDLNIRLTK